MQYEIILGAIIAIIAVGLLLIRTNAAVVFFSLCAGSVLATAVGGETSLFISSFIKNGDASRAIASIGLILLPVLVSAFILRKSVSPGKFLANLLPSIAVGALVVTLIVPYIPGGVRSDLTSNIIWEYLDKFQPLIIVVGMLSSIFLLWLNKDKSKKDKKHKK